MIQFLNSYGIRECLQDTSDNKFMWGDTSDSNKLKLLLTLVKEVFHDKKVLEFGTYRGKTTYAIAKFLTSGTICTIDCGMEELKILLEKENREHNNKIKYSSYDIGELYKDDLDCVEKIRQVVGNSMRTNVVNTIMSEGPYNLIYIDASHTYEGIKNDTEISMNCVAKGGLIIWDDYNSHWTGVSRYLNDLSKELDLIYIEDNRYVLYVKD